MAGDEEDFEIVHACEHVTNVVQGNGFGFVFQAGRIDGEILLGGEGIVIRSREAADD
ncbi:MAG TPA: hypothetical protein VM347_13795 [Nonomuraea sp.]|nr:hypothetical protein [Nonomuraea sp.]